MRWKRIAGAGAIVIIGLIGAGYVIISSYDFNRLKPTIMRAVKDATGRELTLGGDIRLTLGFGPALFVENISLQNVPWGSRPEMAKVKRFELDVAFFPLLFGEVDVKRLILIEPNILIETDKAGKNNLAFETPPQEEPAKKLEKEEKGEGKKTSFLWVVLELRIEKGKILYRDGATGKTYTASLDNFTASASSLESPVKLGLKGSYNQAPIEVAGTLGPMAVLMTPGKSWPLDITAKAAEASLRVNGKIQNPTAFRGLELNFGAQGKEVGNFQALIGKPLPVRGPFDVSGRLTDPAPNVFKVTDLKVTLGESEFNGIVEVNLTGPRPQLSIQGSSKKLNR